MVEIGCPQCGYATELQAELSDLPEHLQCPMCGTWIRTDGKDDREAITRMLETEDFEAPEVSSTAKTKAVAHLLVSGPGSVEPPQALRGSRTLVGRENADITIEDPTMSVRHFLIENRDGQYLLRDLGSTNGTRVNGQRVQAAELKSGDRIQAGLTCLVFRILDTVAEE